MKFSPMIIIGAVVIFIVLAFLIWRKITYNKVLRNSTMIAELKKLNQKIGFHKLQTNFYVSKHYDNKCNYSKVEPSYVIAAEVRSNLVFFYDYTNKIKENRIKQEVYLKKIRELRETNFSIDYKKIRIIPFVFSVFEKRIFNRLIITPVTECAFVATLSYTNPKSEITLTKQKKFNADDIIININSVSREKLDKHTYNMLAAFERGEVSDSLRYDILKRDNFTCVICGASSKQGVNLHVDHIVPIAKGGKSVADNLRTLCERCNIGKSDKLEDPDTAPVPHTIPQTLPLVIPPYKSTKPPTFTAKLNKLFNDGSKKCCPRCGSKLTLRRGKYGQFYGCTSYPKCKYTQKLN